jgi:hypothetical protein
MPSTIRANVDVKSVSQDLRALGDDLDKPIRDTLGEYAEKIKDIGAGFMKHGHGSWPTSSAARDFPGLIADYYDTRVSTLSANIGTTHPGGPVWEYGGDIHPAAGSAKHAAIRGLRGPRRAMLERGHQVIHIPRWMPMTRAADQEAPAFERALGDAVDRLIAEHNF